MSTAARGAAVGISAEPWAYLRARYSRYGAVMGYAIAVLAVYVGWLGRDQRNIHAENGLGYVLGIVGGSLMMILLLYSVRKRVRWLTWLGETRHWFRMHMILGIIGPVLILYHCNFELGDLNSQVALFCTLLVAGSGVLGRYLYAGIHNGLYGSKATLKQLAVGLERTLSEGQSTTLMQPVRAQLADLDRRVLAPSVTFTDGIVRHWVVSWETRRSYGRMAAQIRDEIRSRAAASTVVAQHADRLEAATRRYLHDHLAQLRQVSRFNAFERLFALWHLVHVPFFLMMIFSGWFHVFAVHFF